MLMPPYTIYCYGPDCGEPAVYKIAARWSDGVTQELKTYSLACAKCLPDIFRKSRAKQAACRLAGGESLEPPGIYKLARGQRDRLLERLTELEKQLK